MSDLTKGYTFSGTSPNNQVTAEKLNALVDQASIQTGFYTERGEALNGAEGDYLLLYHTASASFRKIRKSNLITAGVGKPGFTNLVITNSASSPASKLDVSADELVLRHISGNVRYVSAFSRTLDADLHGGTATLDGRDFPTEIADTWYYVWAVSNGTDDRLLLSGSRTSPTLPSGYGFKALLGAVRNDHNSNFVHLVQRNCEVALDVASKAGVAHPYLNPRTGATPAEFTAASCDELKTFQTADLSACIPPHITARVRGLIGTSADPGVANFIYAVATVGIGALDNLSTPVDAVGLQILPTLFIPTAPPMFGFYATACFDVPVQVSQTISWTVTAGVARHNMRIHGYTLAL